MKSVNDLRFIDPQHLDSATKRSSSQLVAHSRCSRRCDTLAAKASRPHPFGPSVNWSRAASTDSTQRPMETESREFHRSLSRTFKDSTLSTINQLLHIPGAVTSLLHTNLRPLLTSLTKTTTTKLMVYGVITALL
jgi:hypothetical protein